MYTSSIKCSECGRDLLPGNSACPDCESINRHIYATDECLMTIKESLYLKGKSSSGFLNYKLKIRDEFSEKSGRSTKNIIVVDRSNPDFTKFHHKVVELDEHGIFFKTIHEHTEISPAKNRQYN